MALTEKDFEALGFVNCTEINKYFPERTRIIFQIVKGDTNLIFAQNVGDGLFRISDGRATVNKIYADAVIQTPYQLRSLLNLYKKNCLRITEE